MIEDNTIEDSLGGIIIGVQHGVNYWGSLRRLSLRDRACVPDGVGDRQHVRVRHELSQFLGGRLRRGREQPRRRIPRLRPSRSASGFSAEAPGPYGTPRFPWTVGNALTVNGNDPPIFVDPIENVVTVQSNSVETIGTNGSVTSDSGLSGQVYAGIVNGVTVAPTLTPETYNNEPYYPFNLDNLDVSTAPPDSNPRRLRRRHQRRRPNPDANADAHSNTDSNAAPTPTHSDADSYRPPPAPSNVSVGLIGLNQIVVSWNASPGASSYIVERSLDGSTWSAIATGVTATSFADSGLNYSTMYYYRVLAVSSAGSSAASAAVGAVTWAQPDVLTGQSLTMNLTRGSLVHRTGRDLHGCEYHDHGGTLRRDDQLGQRTFQPRHGQRQRRNVHGHGNSHVCSSWAFT